MGNNKWNKEDLGEAPVVVLKEPEEPEIIKENVSTQSISGSSSAVTVVETIKVNDKLTNEEPVVKTEASFDVTVEITAKIPESLIIPIEEWPTKMSKNELRAYKEYQRSQFPELFDIKAENDKFSDVPFLKLTKPARMFATFLDNAVKIQEEEKKKKVIH